MPDTSKRTVHVYVFDGLADWEVGLAIAYLNTPAFQPPTPRYCVATVGTQMASVVSMGGIRMIPDKRLDALSPADSAMLILPGGTTRTSSPPARRAHSSLRDTYSRRSSCTRPRLSMHGTISSEPASLNTSQP